MKNKLGYFDARTGEIAINQDLDSVGKSIVSYFTK
jgi:hypothetical protein